MKLNQGVCLLHKGRGGKIFRVDQCDGRGFEDNCANLGTNADELERFKRLDGLAYAGSTDGKLLSQLLFRRQSLARLNLPSSDQVKNVSDYLGGNRLSANQAAPP